MEGGKERGSKERRRRWRGEIDGGDDLSDLFSINVSLNEICVSDMVVILTI